MANFTSFLDILPDPNNPIGEGGEALATAQGGVAGPGFKSIKFTSEAPIQVSRTNSGRVLTRGIAGHKWSVDISYNPMTREDFEPIFSFLLQRKGRLNPFYVQLPNQYTTRNAAFAARVAVPTNPTNVGGLNQGAQWMLQGGHSDTQTTTPKPGDMFTITDTADSLHTKIYRVVRVLDAAAYHNTLHSAPSSSQRIVYFTPNLQRAVSSGQTIIYHQPKIRVILNKDIQEYSLETNNLYKFSLQLEEAQA